MSWQQHTPGFASQTPFRFAVTSSGMYTYVPDSGGADEIDNLATCHQQGMQKYIVAIVATLRCRLGPFQLEPLNIYQTFVWWVVSN